MNIRSSKVDLVAAAQNAYAAIGHDESMSIFVDKSMKMPKSLASALNLELMLETLQKSTR